MRHAIYKTFADGGIPRAATIAHQLRLPVAAVHAAMNDLHDAHAIVLDPRTREPWMALPFSSVPTPFAVEGGGRSWFANCAWDAFGIPILVGVDAMISTTCADCDGQIVYRVEGGRLVDSRGVVHFGVPAAKWWDDIGFT
ncbi:MAG TPA: organomercurial lyase [Vicinamibacterales bacterium]|nr:organomercurial lyase [Vicinamibacterales bacterium]